MKFRSRTLWRTLAAPLALALLLTACGGDDGGGEADGGGAEERPTITIGSFNFGESVTIAEIYAQALEDAGYPVEREFNLGARELIYQDLESGAIDFLPEYVGSALSVGFGGAPTADTDETAQALATEFEAIGFTLLDPSDAQDKNVYVVTAEFAEANGLSTISDLADLETVRFGAAPECDGRETCLDGLENVYGLDNIEFQSIQETPIRVSSLRNGEIEMAALFSTDPPLKDGDLVVLDDDQGITPAENVIPVVNDEIIEAYGDDLVDLVNAISAALTTEHLIAMNTEVYVNGADSADQAKLWLEDNGFLSA